MNIVYRPDKSGEKIPYQIRGSKITFNDELMLNLARYERDEPTSIDVCQDKAGNLVCGVIPGVAESYVAQIEIPAREYREIPAAEDGDSEGEPGGGTLEPLPFDPGKCTLTLWTLV